MNDLKKFVQTTTISDYEVLTDTGWEDIVYVHKTVPYKVYDLRTRSGRNLKCADNHIVFGAKMQEIFAVNLSKGDFIWIDDGQGGILLDEVVFLESKGHEEEMYDLELSEGSNRRYFTNGILSHNSTLLRFIADLDQPTSGDVFVNGLDVRKWRIRLGMVFQEYSSFPWLTVLDNVALGLKYQGVGKKERKARAMEMIKRVGLDGQELKYAKKPGLSGGQLQRVAIARSLLANPQVLLLDEPFGALDVKTRAQMQDLLCSLFEEFRPTIVLVTHDIDEAVYLADEIFILSKPPAVVAHQIKVDLGYHRDRSVKRGAAFLKLKNEVEDIMMNMES